ncbi:damage-inducible protein DinB [Rhizobium cremeum]|uniref:DinB family protein n=1 Tax=Rhizobium cremeum TaxID=2813827 RepID=UPI000DDB19B5|nr:DinB family protein [Rhizobium cremeum]MCJ7994829.1 damage-inducible protein DinB [Rhizobium cremeum]MCJ8000175.1 damage-inducible protein DinB [Rhizobium cremeum]
MLETFRMFAAYNQWANDLVYAAANELSPEDLNRDLGAFFGSLFGTLTHILVADRVWLRRFTGEGPKHTALNEKPFATLAELETARIEEDRRIIAWIGELTEDEIRGPISYTPITTPTPITHRLGPAISHFFNHQTHHRGQAHMCLTALGKPSLSLDLIYFQRLQGDRWL